MADLQNSFQQVFDQLYTLNIEDKILFLEELLCYLTDIGREIWADDKSTDNEKVKAFKWLNELTHRIWNIRFDLKRNEDNDCITRLYENMKFYGEQSDLLRMHLVPTTLGAYKIFKVRR